MRNLHSTQILSCVVCIKQFSSLTKAVHGTACNTSAGLQVLRSRPGCRDLSKTMTQQAQHGRASLAPCFYNFNRCDRRLDMVSTPSKFTTAWWLASNLKTMPLAMKCQINNQKSRASPTQQTWIPLGLGISSNLIGVVLQSPSENILKRQLYVCEGLCWNSNTAETIFC